MIAFLSLVGSSLVVAGLFVWLGAWLLGGAVVNPVEKAHPLLIVPCRCGCGCGLNGKARQHTPDEYEDLDALPVEEQAAIACSIHGSDRGYAYTSWDMIPVGSRAVVVGVACGAAIDTGGWSRDAIADKWAEAEARIRTGMVRP